MMLRALLACFLFGSLASAQRPDSARGTLRQTFREVNAVRELGDGRALVLDSFERHLYLADFRTGDSQVIGEQGWGDRQYLWPSRLLHLSADTTLVWDAIEGRIHVLDWIGGVPAIRRSMPKTAFGPSAQSPFVPVVSDDQGRMYRENPGSDGSVLLRWIPGALRVDTIHRFTRVSAGGMFPVSDKWAVSSTGVLAHVHVSPYRVDFRTPETNAVLGEPVPFDPVLVTPAIQKAWTAFLNEPRIVWAQARGQPPGFEERSEPWVTYGSWPLVMPAIVGRDPLVQFTSSGSLLIERMSVTTLPSEYDVIDTQGKLADRFQLPAGTRIVATGRDVVYVTARAGDGRLTLQRFTVRAK